MQIKEIIFPNGGHYIELIFDDEADWLIFQHKRGQVYRIESVDETKVVFKEIENGDKNDR